MALELDVFLVLLQQRNLLSDLCCHGCSSAACSCCIWESYGKFLLPAFAGKLIRRKEEDNNTSWTLSGEGQALLALAGGGVLRDASGLFGYDGLRAGQGLLFGGDWGHVLGPGLRAPNLSLYHKFRRCLELARDS